MEVLVKGILENGTDIQIENWNDNYEFMPYGNTLVCYPKAKVSYIGGEFAPKEGKTFRCEFTFKSMSDSQDAFHKLLTGNKTLKDYKENLHDQRYANCI